jgi:hypothetical protein
MRTGFDGQSCAIAQNGINSTAATNNLVCRLSMNTPPAADRQTHRHVAIFIV